MPPAVAYGLYRRAGMRKPWTIFPYPAPKTVYCSTLEDEEGVAGVTRDMAVLQKRASAPKAFSSRSSTFLSHSYAYPQYELLTHCQQTGLCGRV